MTSNFGSIVSSQANTGRSNQPVFYQGVDFDEVTGVNVLPFKLGASFAFTTAGSPTQDYVLTVEAQQDKTLFLVEDKYDVNTWKGEFSSAYLEEITRKTGKEKTYTQFLATVGRAIKHSQTFDMYKTGTNYNQYFIDLLCYDDLQLLKAKRDYYQNTQSAQNQVRNNKKYIIFTVVGDGGKVHYPLPLNPVETGPFLMDKDTMRRMVQRMSQTLTEFKSTPNQNHSHNHSIASTSTANNNLGRQTAREFFSRENLIHPIVDENQKLRDKLRMLEEAASKSSRSGNAGMFAIQAEANRVASEYEQYKENTGRDIEQMKRLKKEL